MDETCSGCGMVVAEGTRGCRAMFDELSVRRWDRPVAYTARRMIVDAYALQHPDEFCASPKSLFAHLTGLCAALEHPGHPTLLEALRRSIDGAPSLQKPALPPARGTMTIAEVAAALDAGRMVAVADRWARSVWEACQPLHPLARRWVADALARLE
jgi:uncharacterized protein DUF5946